MNLCETAYKPNIPGFVPEALLPLLLALLLTLGGVTGARGQAPGISGTVTDSDGEPLIGATVVLKNSTTTGTTTGLDGSFRLNVSPGDIIEVSYIGYQTVDYQVGSQGHITIVLTPASEDLDTVVVVGYSTQKKETLVGSISMVKSEGLLQSPVANISNALVGRVPGLSSIQSSGEPGDNATTIRIRGQASLNGDGQDPLIILDGVESTIATMNALDANEIESMSVLKDASATAVYGVKGANGVILITTKRGKSGTAKVNFTYRFGMTQLVSKLQMLDSESYAILRNEAIDSDNDPTKEYLRFSDDEIWKFRHGRDFTEAEIWALYPELSEEAKLALYNSDPLYYTSNDFYDRQFGGMAPQHQYNVNISGGTDNVKYFSSVGYFTQDGLFRKAKYMGTENNSKYGRYNFRSNLDLKLMKYLSMSIDIGGFITESTGILGDSQDGDPSGQYSRHKSMLANIFANPPYVGPGYWDGKLIDGFIQDEMNPLRDKGGSGYSPLTGILTSPLLTSRQSDVSSTLRLEHDMSYLTEGLRISGAVSYSDWQKKGVRQQRWVPVWKAKRDVDDPNEIILAGGTLQQNSITDQLYKYKWNRLYVEAKIDYNRTFGKHAVTGLVLWNGQQTRDPSLAYGVPSGMIGTAARATYGYDQRYLVEFNMGYNGSENFPKGSRFGFFPAVSGGWILTNEKFWPENKWLTWFKIRGSYGEVGNDRIGGRRFLYLPSTWGMSSDRVYNGYWWGNSPNGDVYYSGSYESTVGNPDVTWERSRKSNIGIDMNLFKDRLQIVADVFNENRSNILSQYLSATNTIGISPAPGNIGKVNNKGYEVQLTWTHTVQDFTYSVGAGVSYAVNKIKFMDEPLYPYQWMNTTGFSLGQYKGKKTAGFYNNEAEASNRPYVQADGNSVRPGDVRYVDIDGDGIINSRDDIPIGYSNLPRYTFNASINLAYRNVYVSALFTGAAQGSMSMESFYVLNPFYMGNGNAMQWHYDGRWTAERAEAGERITFPRASFVTEQSQNGMASDLWIRSSQYIRLKNIEVGYSIPYRIVEKMKIGGIRIFASSNNLFTWGSKLISGYDPEQADQGGAAAGYLYPPTRSYNIGVNISF